MPMYEYECADCGKVTETLRRLADADSPIACEHCGKTRTTRKHSVFSAHGPSTTAASPASGGGHTHSGGCGCCGPRGCGLG